MLPPDEPMRTGSFTFKPPYESEAWETEWVEGQPLQSPALGTAASYSFSSKT